jgi:hypothetical protein
MFSSVGGELKFIEVSTDPSKEAGYDDGIIPPRQL